MEEERQGVRQAISLAIWCNVGRPEQGEGQCDTHNLAHRLRNHGTLLQLPIGSSLSPSSMIPRERKNVRWPLIRQLAIRRAHRDWIRLAVLRSIVGQAHNYSDRLRLHACNITVGFITSGS